MRWQVYASGSKACGTRRRIRDVPSGDGRPPHTSRSDASRKSSASPGAPLALCNAGAMAEQRNKATDDIRGLIEKVDGQLREAELIRGFVSDRARRTEFFPERRKIPRIPSSTTEG